MNRLFRANPLGILLVLLAMMPAVMGAASSVVRCEHADASAHLAAANHHEQPDADTDCCCGSDHDTPAPADHPDLPCDDTPLVFEPAPTHPYNDTLDLPEAPLLPVLAWLTAQPVSPHDAALVAWTRGQPPGPEPCLLLKTARFLI